MDNIKSYGLIHIYTGDGKGKTTAAAGLCIRAAGYGAKVVFASFLKGQFSGELKSLEKLGVKIVRNEETEKFTFQMNDLEKEHYRKIQQSIWDKAVTTAQGADVLVLDEIGDAIDFGAPKETDVLQFLQNNKGTEILLTGRGFSEKLLSLADYISEIKAVRHPFEKRISAREGIEY